MIRRDTVIVVDNGVDDVDARGLVELLHDVSGIEVFVHDALPACLVEVDAGVDAVRSVVVGGLDDPGVLVVLDLVEREAVHATFEAIGTRHVCVYEGGFLLG